MLITRNCYKWYLSFIIGTSTSFPGNEVVGTYLPNFLLSCELTQLNTFFTSRYDAYDYKMYLYVFTYS